MEKFDVIVVGGSAAGLITAVTGKSAYPNKKFLVIRKDKNHLFLVEYLTYSTNLKV